MKILVANLGSTSFKYRLFDMEGARELAGGGIERSGSAESPRRAETGGADGGVIARRRRGQNGLGYDPLLYLPDVGRTGAELEADEKNARSHRGAAARAMEARLPEVFERVESHSRDLR